MGAGRIDTAELLRAPLAVAVLGPVEVRSGSSVSRPPAGRQRRILTVLAVAAASGRTVGPDELVDSVYGDKPPARARRSLSTELWRCRQLLGPDAIQTDDEGYRLDPRLVDIDLVRFARGLEAGRSAIESASFDEAERHLTAALALWRGAPLTEWADHPLGQATIARLEELHVGALEDLAEALAGLGRHTEATALLTPVTREHPAREHAWALLIESQLAVGDRRRACTALDSVRRTLAEHGVDLGAELRGVRERLQATNSLDEPRQTSRPRTSSAGRRPDSLQLLGRDDLLHLALDAVDAAVDSGVPEAIVVTGEAGIGKTTFAEAVLVAAEATRPAPAVWRIICDNRLGLPFGALRPVLRQQARSAGVGLPDWLESDSVLPNSADLSVLVDEAAATMVQCAAAHGAVVLVDDAQWASRELIEVLLALLRRPSARIALIATVREPVGLSRSAGESDPSELLRELRHRATHHLRLTGLSADHVRAFLGDIGPGEAERVHRLTGGNPLYLHQLSLSSDGTVLRSPSLTDALDQRIDALPLDVVRILELAAAIGTRFDVRVLTSAAAHPPFGYPPDAVFDALDLAERTGLVTPATGAANATDTAAGHTASFVHALVRDRLYERSPYRQRTTSHALIVGALGRLTGSDVPSVDLLADHSRRAWPVCPTEEVVARLAEAGEAANSQVAFASAQHYFQLALDLIAMDPGYGDDARLEDLLAALGQAAAAAGNPSSARESYESLRQRGIRHRRPLATLRGALGIIWTYAHERIDPRALDHLADAIDAVFAQPSDGSAGEIELIRDALSALHAYRPEAERARRPVAFARGPQFRTPLLTALWEQETIPNARAIADELVGADNHDPLSAALRQWISGVATGTRSMTDEPAGLWALPASDEATWEATVWRIGTTMHQGDFPRALRLVEDAEQLVGRVNTAVDSAARFAQLLGQRMWIAMQTGDATALHAAAVANKPQYTTRRPIMRTAIPLRHIALGELDAARETCDRLVDEFTSGVLPTREVHATVVSLANACLWLRNERGVALCRELLAPHAGEHVLYYVVQYWGSINHHLGRLAIQQGDLDAAIDHLNRATDEHVAVGSRVLATQSHRFLASALWHRHAAGDRAAAEEHHAHAESEALAMGVGDVSKQPWPPADPYGPTA